MDREVVLWLLGGAFTIVSGGWALLWKRIGEVDAEVEKRAGELVAMFNDRQAEGRVDRANLWNRMEALQTRMDERTAALTERLYQVPTREELRQDLAASERRIEQMILGRLRSH